MGGGEGGLKGQKIVQNDEKILSVPHHFSGTIHDMVVIFGADV